MSTVNHHQESTAAPRAAEAPSELTQEIYHEIRRLARSYMRRERAGHTLQTTALVNEAYLRLVSTECLGGVSRQQFMVMFARTMRQILVDHARRRKRRKRGGDWSRVPIHEETAACPGPSLDLLALDDALQRLAAIDPRLEQIIELRDFGGLTDPEIARQLGVSSRQIRREWRCAKLWLARELGLGAGDAA